MKKIFDYANLVLALFLMVSLTANIMIGSMMYHFREEWKERSDNARKERRDLKSHDSAVDLRIEQVIKNQIVSHEILNEMIKQNEKK